MTVYLEKISWARIITSGNPVDVARRNLVGNLHISGEKKPIQSLEAVLETISQNSAFDIRDEETINSFLRNDCSIETPVNPIQCDINDIDLALLLSIVPAANRGFLNCLPCKYARPVQLTQDLSDNSWIVSFEFIYSLDGKSKPRFEDKERISLAAFANNLQTLLSMNLASRRWSICKSITFIPCLHNEFSTDPDALVVSFHFPSYLNEDIPESLRSYLVN